MTTENKEELLRLYKLLWEQIKDEKVILLDNVTWRMLYDYEIITHYEEHKLRKHIEKNWTKSITTTEDKKSFVQRMITELENEIK